MMIALLVFLAVESLLANRFYSAPPPSSRPSANSRPP